MYPLVTYRIYGPTVAEDLGGGGSKLKPAGREACGSVCSPQALKALVVTTYILSIYPFQKTKTEGGCLNGTVIEQTGEKAGRRTPGIDDTAYNYTIRSLLMVNETNPPQFDNLKSRVFFRLPAQQLEP